VFKIASDRNTIEYKVRLAVHLNLREAQFPSLIPHTGNIPKHCANFSMKQKQVFVVNILCDIVNSTSLPRGDQSNEFIVPLKYDRK
jgi:hypothetical protein